MVPYPDGNRRRKPKLLPCPSPKPRLGPLQINSRRFFRLGLEDLNVAQFQTLEAFCQRDPYRLLACLQSFADEGRRFPTPQHLIAMLGRRQQIRLSR